MFPASIVVGKSEMVEGLVCHVGGVIQERSDESTGENIVWVFDPGRVKDCMGLTLVELQLRRFPADHQGAVLQLIPILELELGVQVEKEQAEYDGNFQLLKRVIR